MFRSKTVSRLNNCFRGPASNRKKKNTDEQKRKDAREEEDAEVGKRIEEINATERAQWEARHWEGHKNRPSNPNPNAQHVVFDPKDASFDMQESLPGLGDASLDPQAITSGLQDVIPPAIDLDFGFYLPTAMSNDLSLEGEVFNHIVRGTDSPRAAYDNGHSTQKATILCIEEVPNINEHPETRHALETTNKDLTLDPITKDQPEGDPVSKLQPDSMPLNEPVNSHLEATRPSQTLFLPTANITSPVSDRTYMEDLSDDDTSSCASSIKPDAGDQADPERLAILNEMITPWGGRTDLLNYSPGEIINRTPDTVYSGISTHSTAKNGKEDVYNDDRDDKLEIEPEVVELAKEPYVVQQGSDSEAQTYTSIARPGLPTLDTAITTPVGEDAESDAIEVPRALDLTDVNVRALLSGLGRQTKAMNVYRTNEWAKYLDRANTDEAEVNPPSKRPASPGVQVQYRPQAISITKQRPVSTIKSTNDKRVDYGGGNPPSYSPSTVPGASEHPHAAQELGRQSLAGIKVAKTLATQELDTGRFTQRSSSSPLISTMLHREQVVNTSTPAASHQYLPRLDTTLTTTHSRGAPRMQRNSSMPLPEPTLMSQRQSMLASRSLHHQASQAESFRTTDVAEEDGMPLNTFHQLLTSTVDPEDMTLTQRKALLCDRRRTISSTPQTPTSPHQSPYPSSTPIRSPSYTQQPSRYNQHYQRSASMQNNTQAPLHASHSSSALRQKPPPPAPDYTLRQAQLRASFHASSSPSNPCTRTRSQSFSQSIPLFPTTSTTPPPMPPNPYAHTSSKANHNPNANANANYPPSALEPDRKEELDRYLLRKRDEMLALKAQGSDPTALGLGAKIDKKEIERLIREGKVDEVMSRAPGVVDEAHRKGMRRLMRGMGF